MKCVKLSPVIKNTIAHLGIRPYVQNSELPLFLCEFTKKFWSDLSFFIFRPPIVIHDFILKDVLCYFDNGKDKSLIYMVNFLILPGKFFIHKQKFLESHPSFQVFL